MSQTTLRDHIRNDLRSRLGSSGGPQVDLTLSALARHYGVSLTPIREAFRLMVSEGVLLKQGNGRVAANPEIVGQDEVSNGPGALPSRSLDLESKLADEVIVGSLRGETDYLREESTAQRFGVSRTVIRQAFNRLAGRGLLDHVPRCGWRVRRFEENDLRAYLEVRETLELKALDLARTRLDPETLSRMLDANRDDPDSPRIDNQLHRYLIDTAANRYISDFFEAHSAYYISLFDYAAPETHVVAEMASQHREVLRALLDRDWPAARRALAQHIRAQEPIVKGLIRRIGRSESSPESFKS